MTNSKCHPYEGNGFGIKRLPGKITERGAVLFQQQLCLCNITSLHLRVHGDGDGSLRLLNQWSAWLQLLCNAFCALHFFADYVCVSDLAYLKY